jgi:hypothetical protein
VRQSLNSSPVVQVIVLGVLAIVVAFLLFTRVLGQDDEASPPPTTPTTAAPTTATPAPAAPAATPSEAPIAPSSDGAAPPAEGFVAGPGLPRAVVDAHEGGDAVVLLVTTKNGIDDRRMEAIVKRLDGADSAVFSTRAQGIARYSRITQGLDVDRVPALVVIEPRRLADGALPQASVSYGFRSPESAEQAVRDALYQGRDNIPYHPE